MQISSTIRSFLQTPFVCPAWLSQFLLQNSIVSVPKSSIRPSNCFWIKETIIARALAPAHRTTSTQRVASQSKTKRLMLIKEKYVSTDLKNEKRRNKFQNVIFVFIHFEVVRNDDRPFFVLYVCCLLWVCDHHVMHLPNRIAFGIVENWTLSFRNQLACICLSQWIHLSITTAATAPAAPTIIMIFEHISFFIGPTISS